MTTYTTCLVGYDTADIKSWTRPPKLFTYLLATELGVVKGDLVVVPCQSGFALGRVAHIDPTLDPNLFVTKPREIICKVDLGPFLARTSHGQV